MASRRTLITSLDVGSSAVRAVIAEYLPDEDMPRVVGVGTVSSAGVRRGAVIDAEEAARSISAAVAQAEGMAGEAVEQVFVSVNGADIFSQEAVGVVAVGKSDGEVVEDDVDRVLAAAQARANVPLNREILHVLPKDFRLDDQKNIKDPLGMRGVRLEVEALLIGGSTPHLKNLTRAVEQAKMSVAGFVADPLATAAAILQPRHKELGVASINMGAATTTLSVYEEGELLHVKVIPIGSSHITNDIAIGLRTSIEVAEAIKLHYGTALPETVERRAEIQLGQFDSQETDSVSSYHVAEIIQARLEEIVQFVQDELQSIGRAELLPSGAILTGGGAKLPGVVEVCKRMLKLPAQVGYPKALGGILDKVDDPEFAAAVGLILWAEKHFLVSRGNFSWGGLTGKIGGTTDKVKQWLEKFLP